MSIETKKFCEDNKLLNENSCNFSITFGKFINPETEKDNDAKLKLKMVNFVIDMTKTDFI